MAYPPVRALMVPRRAPGRVRNHTPTTAHPLFRFACEFVKRAELHRAKAGAVHSAAGSEERGNRFREVQWRCRRTARGKCGAWCVAVDGEFDDGAFLRAVVRQRQADFEFCWLPGLTCSDRRRLASSTGRRSANDSEWSTDVSLTAVRDPNAQRGVAVHRPPRGRLWGKGDDSYGWRGRRR